MSKPNKAMPDCGCTYKWKGYGYLYGISMGDGWVRMDASPHCKEGHR